MTRQPLRRCLLVLLALPLLALAACDDEVVVEIENGTDGVLRVELEEASYADETIARALLPDQITDWSQVCGPCPADLGQIRAYAPDGQLVYERALRVEDGQDGCRVTLDQQVLPETVADCLFPHGSGDVVDSVVVVNRLSQPVTVYARGEFRGRLDPRESLGFILFSDEGRVFVAAESLSGELLWRTVLRASDAPRDVTIRD